MRQFLALALSLALVGCATGPVKLPVNNLAASDQVRVEDVRPKTEATSEIFSLLITSDQYGYSRVKEEVVDPTGPRLFAHELQQKYGAGQVPPVKLHHFVVYLNQRAALRSFAVGAALGGIIGAAIADGTVKREGDIANTLVATESFAALSGPNEYKRALYLDSELKEGTSAFVVFIESETNGQRRFTRTVAPIKAVKEGEKLPLHQALDAAIRFNLNP